MKRTVCVDLDGVLADYSMGWKGLDHIGDPIPGAVELTQELAKFADVLIFTTRCCEEMGRGLGKEMLRKIVKDWLDKHGFVYHEIWIGQGKPIASAYIDDRAICCRPQEDARAFQSAVVKAQRLCEDAKKKDKVD